jgi:transposase
VARPTKLTAELTRKLGELVAAGVELPRAAACVGLAPRTVERWRARGAAARAGPYRDLYLALEQADAQAEVRDILLIGKAAQTNWKAAAWRLERRFPDRWGPKRPVEARPETSAEEAAARIRDALRAMRDSVEGPPGGSAADAS